MNYRTFIIMAAISLFVNTVYGQKEFRKPVKNETIIEGNLFTLQPDEYNHIFQAALPGDNFLLIDFEKMSYWPDTSMLNNVFVIAANVVREFADSFPSAISSKRIDIHLPIDNKPIQVRLKDHTDGNSKFVLNYEQEIPLKIGMDTVRIIKTIATANKDKPGVIQYTFVLKELNGIFTLLENKELIGKVAQTFDSVVQYRRDRWRNEDVWYHQLGIRYVAEDTDSKKQLQVKRPAGFLKGLDANYYIGATLFRNDIVPYLEIGGSYKWRDAAGKYDFFRLSFSSLAQFERLSESTYNFYGTSFINVEMGTYINKTDTWIPIYETSIGFGYMFTNHPSLSPHKMMKMFWNFSLSPAVRITPDIYVLYRKKQDNYVWPGITLTLKFF